MTGYFRPMKRSKSVANDAKSLWQQRTNGSHIATYIAISGCRSLFGSFFEFAVVENSKFNVEILISFACIYQIR